MKQKIALRKEKIRWDEIGVFPISQEPGLKVCSRDDLKKDRCSFEHIIFVHFNIEINPNIRNENVKLLSHLIPTYLSSV